MTDIETIAAIYVIGVVISAIVLGFEADYGDDWVGGYSLAVLWPVILMTIGVCALVGGPFWLGQQIRRLFK